MELTKKQLSERALALGVELGTEVKTDGLNHQALTALVASLDSQAKDKARASVVLDGSEALPEGYVRPSVEEFVAKGYLAENYEKHFADFEHSLLVDVALAKRSQAPEGSGETAKPEAGERRYILAPNKALHCLRGVLGEGEEVFAADIGEKGAERLLELDADGHFVK